MESGKRARKGARKGPQYHHCWPIFISIMYSISGYSSGGSGTQEGMLSSFAGPTILLWGSNTRTMQNGSRSNWVRGCEGSRWNYIQRKQD